MASGLAAVGKRTGGVGGFLSLLQAVEIGGHFPDRNKPTDGLQIFSI